MSRCHTLAGIGHAGAGGPATAPATVRSVDATNLRPWSVLIGVSIVSFLGCLDLTIVNTAGPAIGRDLGLGVTALGVVVNIVVVALSMFMVVAGRVGDLLGRDRALYIGSVLFGVASLGAGFAPTAPWLVLCRFAQGAACAFLYTSSSTIVSDTFDDARRGRAIGTLFAVNGLGLAAGPLLGGVIVGTLGWPWLFWVNVPLVALSLAICVPTVGPGTTRDADVRLDWPGLLLLVVGLSGILFALTFQDTFGPGAWPVVVPFTVGLLALVLLVRFERRVAHPIVPFALLARRLFLAAITSEFSLAFFYTTVLFLTPLYLGVIRGLDPVAIGWWMLPMTATVALLSPVTGRLVDRVGPIAVITGGFGAFTVSAALQGLLGPAGSPTIMVVAFVLMGAGWACVLGPSAVAALSSVPSRLGGLAVGAGWTFHNVGGAVGLALGSTLYRASAGDTSITTVTPEAFTAGHRAAMILVGCVAAAAALSVSTLGRQHRPARNRDGPVRGLDPGPVPDETVGKST